MPWIVKQPCIRWKKTSNSCISATIRLHPRGKHLKQNLVIVNKEIISVKTNTLENKQNQEVHVTLEMLAH